MSIIAKLYHLRIAPRKVRLVADLIRGKSVEEAQTILHFTVKKGALPLLKLLKSAVANARHNFQLEESNLYISKIIVDEGRKYKRWRAASRGRALEILKRTSRVTIYLDEMVKKPKKAKKIKKAPLRVVKEFEEKEKIIKKQEKREEKKKPSFEKFKPELEVAKPKIEKGIRRIFRRKAF